MRLRISTIVALGAAAIAGLVLFQTSQNVQQAESHLRNTQEALSKEQASVRVLETEWDYLNRPDRIEELARRHLKMQAPTPGALVRNSGQAINPPPPKPEVKTRPATAKTAPPVVKTDVPMPLPVTNTPNRQFDDLLNSVTGGEQ